MTAQPRNSSIDIFRYVAAVLVVSLHVTAFIDIHPWISYIFAQILPRISVPFFFTVSGYYFTSRMEQNKARPREYLTKLVITYTLWSCLYYLVNLAIFHTFNIKQLLYSFFVSGSSYHFWFFPAIILSTALTTIFFKLKCQKALVPTGIALYGIACLGSGYYEIGSRIPILSALIDNPVFHDISNILCFGFSYFICGYLIFKSKTLMTRLSNRTKITVFIFAFMFFFGEIVAIKALDLAKSISVTIGLYFLTYSLMLVLLSNPLPQLQNLSTKCRTLANFTYYSHVMVITLLSQRLQLNQTLMFISVVLITLVLGLVLSKIKHPLIKSFLT